MDDVLIERRDAVIGLQLNRPGKKNALTGKMYDALAAGLQGAAGDAGVRAVLLHAAGDTFTAGHDLRDSLEDPPRGAESPVYRFMSALVDLPLPVVAAVQGAAVGIGTTLLLHCDLVYCAPDVRFHVPFVDLGLVPEFASSALLPALAGHRRAAEMLLLGKPFEARTAVDIGLVTATVDRGGLLQAAWDAAQALSAKPPAALRLTKMLMKRSAASLVEDAMREEGRLFADRLTSPEAKEAFAAFLQKRRPETPRSGS